MSDIIELNINAAKKAELGFDVHIQGISSDDPMEVRMIIKNIDITGSLMFQCEHIEEDNWCVKFPALTPLLKQASYEFTLEVIVDGYYFAPVEGKINFITDPTVNMDKKKSRPKVKAAFTVKQDDVVEERLAQGAGDISNDSAPTTALLEPEIEPTEVPLPGHLLPKTDENGDDVAEDVQEAFNPVDVAGSIIKSMVGKTQPPTTKGFLFPRSGEGKPVIRGLEDKATKQLQEEKAAKVRQILSGE